MANYDRPAYTYPSITIDYAAQANGNQIGIPSISDSAWNAQMQFMINAFGTLTGGSPGSPSGQDINGYGYSHSG